MRYNKYLIFTIIITIAVLSLSLISAQQYNEVDLNSSSGVGQLSVQVLRYEPYPVNPGTSFNVWIKVQNMGLTPAPNAKFKLVPTYPFTSNDILENTYGTISSITDINQVVMEYRVTVANDAPEGVSNLKFLTMANGNDPNSLAVTTNLPIVIGKTNTDFQMVMQTSTSQGTSFALSNIGQNTATAVSVSLLPEQGLNVTGPTSSIIGNLNSGDFTTVNFPISPNKNLKEVTMKIDYTNTAGIRESVNQTIPVNLEINTTQTSTNKGLPGYVYVIIGIILGIIIVYIYRKIRKKK